MDPSLCPPPRNDDCLIPTASPHDVPAFVQGNPVAFRALRWGRDVTLTAIGLPASDGSDGIPSATASSGPRVTRAT
jgi:hypothetical protein